MEQKRFLAAFRDGGTIKAGLANVKVCPRTVELWRQQNLLQFAERFQVTVLVGEELATRL